MNNATPITEYASTICLPPDAPMKDPPNITATTYPHCVTPMRLVPPIYPFPITRYWFIGDGYNPLLI